MVRKGGPQDLRFLRDMLHHAYYWRERQADPLVQRYVRGWGRPGDTAVIAVEGGFAVGAAWFRLFTTDEPGYGFVDEETPELAIGVVPTKRGHGYGEELLAALIERAKAGGFATLSLSVAPDNPALKLYEHHGFVKVAESEGSWTMRAELQALRR